MAELTFFSKPGCVTNRRQKFQLLASGHNVREFDLLSQNWSPQLLRPYFGSKPVSQWFNPSSPRIKSGEISINKLSEKEALQLMVSDPLLIRRPLIHSDNGCGCGWSDNPILPTLEMTPTVEADLDTCSETRHSHHHLCSSVASVE